MGWRRIAYERNKSNDHKRVSKHPDNRVFCYRAFKSKFLYPTKKKALLACKYSDTPQRYYYCDMCCGYHTTSKSLEEYHERTRPKIEGVGHHLEDDIPYEEDFVAKMKRREREHAEQGEKDRMRDTMKEYQKRYTLPIYCGFFLPKKSELFERFPPSLIKPIEYPHLTTVFHPKFEDVHFSMFGRQLFMKVIAYGNDGRNEGVLVEPYPDTEVMREIMSGVEVPHITLSVSRDGKPVDTARLEFEAIDEPFVISARYGGYYSVGVFTREADLFKREIGDSLPGADGQGEK